MSDIALLHATFPDRDTAERIVRAVVEERLAACGNILAPCLSIYRWEDAVERAEEVPALFKSTIELAEQLRARIVSLHPYALPVVEMWPVAAGNAVFGWVHETTG